jgi:hypothetical protein
MLGPQDVDIERRALAIEIPLTIDIRLGSRIPAFIGPNSRVAFSSRYLRQYTT